MQHTPEELALLKAAVLADPVAAQHRLDGSVKYLTDWLNAPSAVLAWKPLVAYQDMVENLNYATFDSVTAGKRDAFKIMLDAAKSGQLDGATTAKPRKGIADIFAVVGGYTDSAQAPGMLNGAFVEFATNAQAAIGYAQQPAAVAGVTAQKRKFTGQCAEDTANWLINN